MVVNTSIKKGYKQTEVGIMPEDWVMVKFGDVLKVRHGKSQKSVEVLEGEYPILATGGEIGRTNTFLYNKPSVMIGRKGTIDRPRYTETPFWTVDTLFYTEIFKNAVPKYIFYKFSTIDWYLYNEASGVPSLNAKTIENIHISLPSTTSEQSSIVMTLSDVDTLIEKLEKLITKKRDIKTATMQQLLTGKSRLVGFDGKWEKKKLGDLSEMGSGGTPLSSVPAYYDGDIPWVSISDMTKGGKVILITDRNLTREGLMNSATQMFPIGTVLYAMYASLGECSIAGVSLCSSQAILGIRPKKELDGEFLYYFLTYLKPVVKTMGQQGTQSNLNKKMVQDFSISLPSVSEQNAIVTVLVDMDNEITELEHRLSKTRELKQGMMQQLLTGNIRLI